MTSDDKKEKLKEMQFQNAEWINSTIQGKYKKFRSISIALIAVGAMSCLTIIGVIWGIPMIIGGIVMFRHTNKKIARFDQKRFCCGRSSSNLDHIQQIHRALLRQRVLALAAQLETVTRYCPVHPVADVARHPQPVGLVRIYHQPRRNVQRFERAIKLLAARARHVPINIAAQEHGRLDDPLRMEKGIAQFQPRLGVLPQPPELLLVFAGILVDAVAAEEIDQPRAAFGPLVAFMVSWSYWVSLWIGNAAIAVAGVSYFGAQVPEIATVQGGDALAACVLIWALTALNLRGARSVGGFQLGTTIIKVVPLLVVMVSAGGDRARLGAGVAAAAGGRSDPACGRHRRHAHLVGAARAGNGHRACRADRGPAESIAHSGAPFVEFVRRFWGPGPALLIAGFAAISCIAALRLVLGGGTTPGRLFAAASWLPWIAGLATLYAAWTIYGTGGEAVAWGAALLLLSLPAYWLSAGSRRAAGLG